MGSGLPFQALSFETPDQTWSNKGWLSIFWTYQVNFLPALKGLLVLEDAVGRPGLSSITLTLPFLS